MVNRQSSEPSEVQWAPLSSPRANGLAIMSLVSVFIFGPLAVILGHMARHQIRRTGESGAGIALGALIIGYFETAFILVMVLVVIAQSSSSYA
jgi:hypothetical protein